LRINRADAGVLRAAEGWEGQAGVEVGGPALVTIAFLDGRRVNGKLAKFSPQLPDLLLELDPSQREKLKSPRLRAEELAYIAFQRGVEPMPAVPTQHERWRVRVAGGEELCVHAAPQSVSSPLGFLARPVSDERFRAIYFYRHGVSARERDAPLGAMLVSAGVLGKTALEQGIAAQSAGRNVPIGQILIEQKKLDKDTVDEAAELQKRKRLRLGEVLQEAGLVSAQDIEQALAEQKKRKGKRLGEVLVDMGFLQERDLALTLSVKFDLPFVNLDEVALNPDAAALAGRDFIAKYGVLPLDVDAKTLTLAVADPTSIDPIDALRVQTQRRIRDVLVTSSQLKRHVAEYLQRTEAREAAFADEAMSSILQGLTAENVKAAEPEDDDAKDLGAPRDDEGGIIRLVNQIIIDAYRRGVSDIHIEPNGKERNVAVRFRIDGECSLYQELPPIVRNALISRIKIISKLDISERRKPQDGKIRFKLPDRQLELRVATIPTVNGNEDVVMRILAASKPLPLDNMGLSARNLMDLKRVAAQPYGLILCVGPTGSGKTTTLHSVLGYLNTPDMKIWTAEDPVEITQAGLRQVQVQPKIGFNFAAAMRAFLRADPDVIMVGEMRDPETASTAVEASLTGHLVLSTLHTNSAPETITRLLDMGLDPFSFGDALLGVLAQRLARALCKQCKVREAGSEEEYADITRAYGVDLFNQDLGIPFGGDFELFRPRGCEACGNSGYKGRLGLHELLVTNDEVKHAIAEKAPVEQIRTLAIRSGMRTLLQDGVQKVLAGQTDMKQVLAVCSR
jgi:type II secretory ATPase GspE/PulE/Tfp pilus assembly ATPase PilB-like protein